MKLNLIKTQALWVNNYMSGQDGNFDFMKVKLQDDT